MERAARLQQWRLHQEAEGNISAILENTMDVGDNLTLTTLSDL